LRQEGDVLVTKLDRLGPAGTYRHYLFSPLFKDVGQPSALNASKERDGMLLDILAVRRACVLRDGKTNSQGWNGE
jgi:hypothetical protein